MIMMVPDITEIWDEILSEKMIKKNRQYGNSVYDEEAIFSDGSDVEELIKVRLDDKLRRLKTLDPLSAKYDSELMEIVAYLMHLLNYRKNSSKYDRSYTYDEVFKEENKERWVVEEHKKELPDITLATGRPIFPEPDTSCDRQQGDEEQSSEYFRKVFDDKLCILGLRRLPSGERRMLREEDIQ